VSSAEGHLKAEQSLRQWSFLGRVMGDGRIQGHLFAA